MPTRTDPITLPWGLSALRRLPIPRKLGLLELLFGRTLASYGVSWIQTSNGVVWKLNLAEASERWIVFGDYEGPVQMNWIRSRLARGGVVVDSGANIGQMLLYLAPMPSVRIYAIEPVPEHVEWLGECLSGYPGWNVRLIEKGLSEASGKAIIQCWGARSTTRLDWYSGRNFNRIEIPLDRLDAILEEHGEDKVALWILDVEGGEEAALKGATGYLERGQIEAILIETLSDKSIQLLRRHRYDFFKFQRNGKLTSLTTDLEILANRNVVVLLGVEYK